MYLAFIKIFEKLQYMKCYHRTFSVLLNVCKEQSHVFETFFLHVNMCTRVSFWREGWEGFVEPWDDIDFIS